MGLKFNVYGMVVQNVPVTDFTSLVLQLQFLICTVLLLLLQNKVLLTQE